MFLVKMILEITDVENMMDLENMFCIEKFGCFWLKFLMYIYSWEIKCWHVPPNSVGQAQHCRIGLKVPTLYFPAVYTDRKLSVGTFRQIPEGKSYPAKSALKCQHFIFQP